MAKNTVKKGKINIIQTWPDFTSAFCIFALLLFYFSKRVICLFMQQLPINKSKYFNYYPNQILPQNTVGTFSLSIILLLPMLLLVVAVVVAAACPLFNREIFFIPQNC